VQYAALHVKQGRPKNASGQPSSQEPCSAGGPPKGNEPPRNRAPGYYTRCSAIEKDSLDLFKNLFECGQKPTGSRTSLTKCFAFCLFSAEVVQKLRFMNNSIHVLFSQSLQPPSPPAISLPFTMSFRSAYEELSVSFTV
jgi:hypothetical protein